MTACDGYLSSLVKGLHETPVGLLSAARLAGVATACLELAEAYPPVAGNLLELFVGADWLGEVCRSLAWAAILGFDALAHGFCTFARRACK